LARRCSVKALTKKATVYLEPDIHRVLKIKSAETSRSVSDLVNEAVRESLREDAEDLEVFEERAREPLISFEDVLKDLKRRGRL
jgi:predicted DNA-binding protein